MRTVRQLWTLNWMRWIAWCERHVPLVQVYRYHLTPAQDISLARHVQLLEMTHDRLVYSFNAMPFVALAAVGFMEARMMQLGWRYGAGATAQPFLSANAGCEPISAIRRSLIHKNSSPGGTTNSAAWLVCMDWPCAYRLCSRCMTLRLNFQPFGI